MTPEPSQKLSSPIPPRTADTPTKVYKGGCHCRKFEFECRHPVLEDGFEVVSCNCSICIHRGYLIMYMAKPEDFSLLKGTRSELTGYQFHTNGLTHFSCPVCASGVFIEGHFMGAPYMSVNVRTVDDLDVEKLTIKKWNGRAL